MREKFQALVIEIFVLFTLYETNAYSLCFIVRAADRCVKLILLQFHHPNHV